MSKGLKAMQDIADARNKKKSFKDALKLMNEKGIVFVGSKPKDILKVSFDFDGCLTETPMQVLCTKFLKLGAEVFITTSRGTEMRGGLKLDNTDLFQLADELGIKRENITFTNYDDKFKSVKDCDLHFDDDDVEIFNINEYPLGHCIGILYSHNFNKENQIAEF